MEHSEQRRFRKEVVCQLANHPLRDSNLPSFQIQRFHISQNGCPVPRGTITLILRQLAQKQPASQP
jgi:hypothetical protein